MRTEKCLYTVRLAVKLLVVLEDKPGDKMNQIQKNLIFFLFVM